MASLDLSPAVARQSAAAAVHPLHLRRQHQRSTPRYRWNHHPHHKLGHSGLDVEVAAATLLPQLEIKWQIHGVVI
ncbi:unnamed protein product [Urochloa humidicola]